MPVTPEEHRNIWSFLGDDNADFYDLSKMAVACSAFACGVQDYELFLENTSRYAVFSASWFNSGYMLLPVYVVVFLAGCGARRAVFLSGFQALMPCIMAGLDQRDGGAASQFQFIVVVVIPTVFVIKRFPCCWTQ